MFSTGKDSGVGVVGGVIGGVIGVLAPDLYC